MAWTRTRWRWNWPKFRFGLHTFTVGAPLSFLDHHLRCGNSLFGAWVRPALETAESADSLFLREPLSEATRAATPMQAIEALTDAEIAEAHRSANIFSEISTMTAPLDEFLSVLHAMDWLSLRDGEEGIAFLTWLGERLIGSTQGSSANLMEDEHTERFAPLLRMARALIDEERFLNWQVAFPGVWSDWEEAGLHGGFDAVIGNPPWDQMKLQQVEWFAARRLDIAKAPRAADRKRMVAELEKANDPLALDFALANERAATSMRMARDCGDYPLLARGDLNIYSLFVERSMTLVKPEGMVGLLVPSGIASGKSAGRFFKGVATEGRLKALYDFENKKSFFADVHGSQKFCVFVASPSSVGTAANCAFYLHKVAERHDPERCFPLTAKDFAQVNPNTGTAPVFRSRRDAKLTTAIYGEAACARRSLVRRFHQGMAGEISADV